jgi:hypothetical protein
VNWVKTWLALALAIIVLLSVNALAVSTVITEGVTVKHDNAPLETQQSASPIQIDTSMLPLDQSGSGNAGGVSYTLELITPEEAIEESQTGVPVNGPNPTTLITPHTSQPSEGQPSVGTPHGYITIPWWLVEYIEENWWLLLLLAILIIVVFLYLKHREEVTVVIEIPKWAT